MSTTERLAQRAHDLAFAVKSCAEIAYIIFMGAVAWRRWLLLPPIDEIESDGDMATKFRTLHFWGWHSYAMQERWQDSHPVVVGAAHALTDPPRAYAMYSYLIVQCMVWAFAVGCVLGSLLVWWLR